MQIVKPRERLTPAQVSARLVDMFITMSMTERPTGPAGFRSALPYIVREMMSGDNGDEEDSVVWLNQPTRRHRLRASPEQITAMNAAVSWPLEYLKDRPDESRCVLAWAYASAKNIPYDRFYKALGLTKSEFERSKAKAVIAISKGLAGRK